MTIAAIAGEDFKPGDEIYMPEILTIRRCAHCNEDLKNNERHWHKVPIKVEVEPA